MTEIPADIMKAAREAIDGLKCFPPSDKEPIQISVARAILAERKRCAAVAENIASAECKELVREKRWIDMTDDYGEPLGQMAEGALHRIDYRKGIAAAIRRGEE